MVEKAKPAHIALVASRPDDAASVADFKKAQDSSADGLSRVTEEQLVQAFKQAALRTEANTKHPEKAAQQSEKPQGPDRTIREELTKQAMLAIEYCPDIAAAWDTLRPLPKEYQDCFLFLIGARPQQDAGKLAAKLLAKYRKVQKPYRDEAANAALANARTIGAEAEAEFMAVYELLGERVTPEELLRKIEAKFGPSEPTRTRLRQEQEAREREARALEALENKRRKLEALEREAKAREIRERAELEQKAREREAEKRKEIEREAREKQTREAIEALEAQMQQALEQEARKRKKREALEWKRLEAQEALVRDALARKAMVQQAGRYNRAPLGYGALAILLALLAAAAIAI